VIPPDFAPQQLQVSAITCQGCGAALPLTALTSHIVCSHCQKRQELAADVVTRLAAYQEAVSTALTRVRQRLEARDLWAHRGRTGATRSWALVAVAVLFLLLLLVGLPLAFVLDRFGIADSATLIRSMLLVLLGVVLLGLVVGAYTWTGAARRRAPPFVWPETNVCCSGCGGDNVMRMGQLVGACRFCRASCAATAEKVQSVLERAEHLYRVAALEKYAAQRAVYTPRSNLPLLRRRDPDYYLMQLESAYCSPAAQAAAASQQALANELGGRLLNGDGFIAWLDQHWPAEHSSVSYFWQHPRWAIALEVGAFSLLVEAGYWPDLYHVARTKRTRELHPTVSVLLNAKESAASNPVESFVQPLEALGWTVSLNEAGLCASRANGPSLPQPVLGPPIATIRDATPLRQVLELLC
jgi:hypothetical protein